MPAEPIHVRLPLLPPRLRIGLKRFLGIIRMAKITAHHLQTRSRHISHRLRDRYHLGAKDISTMTGRNGRGEIIRQFDAHRHKVRLLLSHERQNRQTAHRCISLLCESDQFGALQVGRAKSLEGVPCSCDLLPPLVIPWLVVIEKLPGRDERQFLLEGRQPVFGLRRNGRSHPEGSPQNDPSPIKSINSSHDGDNYALPSKGLSILSFHSAPHFRNGDAGMPAPL